MIILTPLLKPSAHHVAQGKAPQVVVVVELGLRRRSKFPTKHPQLTTSLGNSHRLMGTARRRGVRSFDQRPFSTAFKSVGEEFVVEECLFAVEIFPAEEEELVTD